MSFPDFGLSDTLFFFVQIIATIGGAIVGWFVADPVTRALYWIAMRASAPGLLLFGTKTFSSIVLAVAIFFLMKFTGGGGGGLGFGPGSGGLPGKGPGEGGKGDAVSQTKDKVDPDNKNKSTATPTKTTRSIVEIEILGGAKFKGEDRYFLVVKSDSAFKFPKEPLALKELDPLLKDNKDKIEIRIILTDDSAQITTDNDPTRRLQRLAKFYGIPSL